MNPRYKREFLQAISPKPISKTVVIGMVRVWKCRSLDFYLLGNGKTLSACFLWLVSVDPIVLTGLIALKAYILSSTAIEKLFDSAWNLWETQTTASTRVMIVLWEE